MTRRKPEQESRRWFLEELGLGAGAVGLFGFGFLSMPGSASAQVCAPPGTPGTPVPWKRDCRPIRPRRPASSLSSAEVQKLRDAYKAMRDLAVSDPNDPRGFDHQANIHCFNCGVSIQVHGSWQFFAWHRAYLYFHERILGKLIGDMDFRLPYWDWDVDSHRPLPPAYAMPGNAGNPLWNSTRVNTPLGDGDVGGDVMEAALMASDFPDFGGTATSSGIPEGALHGSVHVRVGGNMGAFSTAGRDPVFYAHHSNVDKIWSDWNKGSATHDNPTDPAFLNLAFTFYDENKVWRSISASRVLDHESRLRYVYGPSSFFEKLPCLLDWVIIKTSWRLRRVLEVGPAIREQLTKTVKGRGRVRLHIDGLQIPLNRSAVYRVYADAKEAQLDRGPESPSYLGAVPVVLNDPENRYPVKKPPRAVFNVTNRLANLLDRRGPIELTAVESGVRDEARKVLPVQAIDVYFSRAEVE